MTKYHFTTKDLVTIALLSALGGVLSTYIGYLGNMVNHIMGVPFGAGQFMAGLHVIWIMLALGVTKKKGAATATGILKGVVELFMGGTHGVVIVIVSAIQGIIPDLVLFSDRAKGERNAVMYSLAGGFSAASNVIVFQAFFFSGVPFLLIAMLVMLAAGSGIVFGGWLVLEMLESLEFTGIIPSKRKVAVDDPSFDERVLIQSRSRKRKSVIAVSVVALFLIAFTVGAVYYFVFVFALPGGNTVQVWGMVENPFDFEYEEYLDARVTIEAELIGSVTHVAPRNYTGIPLRDILENACPLEGATVVRVIGSDGYYADFALPDVLIDDTLILIEEEDGFRLVAAEYEGAYWIELVVEIEVR